ncbi:hypothetical protein JHK87_050300 [Glycine soja]|nr:hypothetical protein JHK87_050300 [Glycine soja]
MALCSVFLNLHLLLFVCLTIEALGVAKPSVASYLSQEILAEQEVDRAHGLPAQPPVKFNNMVVISLSMKLKEEHCSIGFSRPLTNQNKNPFSFGSMEVYDYLVDTAAFVQTRESINEFLTSVKQHDLAKAKVLSILNIGPAADFELYPQKSKEENLKCLGGKLIQNWKKKP